MITVKSHKRTGKNKVTTVKSHGRKPKSIERFTAKQPLGEWYNWSVKDHHNHIAELRQQSAKYKSEGNNLMRSNVDGQIKMHLAKVARKTKK